jgi:demethylmenaquinone methyltransferase/2-methoxy-6-polyprenyl-1,4-benzoquinol methylase
VIGKRHLYRWFYNNIHCHYYDLVTGWCFLPLGGEARVRQTLVDMIDLKEGDRVLDLCCGTGSTTSYLAAKIGKDSKVEAIDLSEGQIAIAKRKTHPLNIEFAVMDASQTSFEDGVFDKVVIPHALHEMPRPVRSEVLREARRVLADGGSLAVLEMDTPRSLFRHILLGIWWFYWLPLNPETPTRRDMLEHGLLEEVRAAGFKNTVKTSVFGGALQVVTGEK